MSSEPQPDNAILAKVSVNLKTSNSEEILTATENCSDISTLHHSVPASNTLLYSQQPTEHHYHDVIGTSTAMEQSTRQPSHVSYVFHHNGNKNNNNINVTTTGNTSNIYAPVTRHDTHMSYASMRPAVTAYQHNPPMTYYEYQRMNTLTSAGSNHTPQYMSHMTTGYYERPPTATAASYYYKPASVMTHSMQHTSMRVPRESIMPPASNAPSLSSLTMFASAAITNSPYTQATKPPMTVQPNNMSLSSPCNGKQQKRVATFEKSCHPFPCCPKLSLSLCCLCTVLVPIALLSIVAVGFFIDFTSPPINSLE